jgi:hypothetical protein
VRCEEYVKSAVKGGLEALNEYEMILNGVSLRQVRLCDALLRVPGGDVRWAVAADVTRCAPAQSLFVEFQNVPWNVPYLKFDLRKQKHRQMELRRELRDLPAAYEEADKWLVGNARTHTTTHARTRPHMHACARTCMRHTHAHPHAYTQERACTRVHVHNNLSCSQKCGLRCNDLKLFLLT